MENNLMEEALVDIALPLDLLINELFPVFFLRIDRVAYHDYNLIVSLIILM